MALSEREKRAVMLGGVVVVALVLVLQLGPSRQESIVTVSSASIQIAERRLTRLQEVAKGRPRAVADSDAAAAALGQVEKGLLKGGTPALALAEMQQLAKELLQGQGIAMQSSEFGTVKAVGEDYAQVPLTVNFSCGVEQWINLMAAIRNAPQVLSTQDVRLTLADVKAKTLHVRMAVVGYVPASLAPSKGVATL